MTEVVRQNAFTEFNLTQEESLAGLVLTVPQIRVMQNRIADLATQLIELIPPVEESGYRAYIQEHARLNGAMEELRWMLAAHDVQNERINNQVNHNLDDNQ